LNKNFSQNKAIKNIILIVVPSAISIYRHSKTLSVASNLIPVLFIELVPFIVLSILQSSNLIMAVLSYFLLCVFYEIGYVLNDAVINEAEENKTDRSTIDVQYVAAFILFRFILLIAIIYIIKIHYEDYFAHYLIFSILLSIIFFIHNKSTKVSEKVFTFTSLNALKLLFRTYSVCEPASFFLSASPYIIMKLIHYLNHKKVFLFNELQFMDLVYPIYGAFAITVSLFDINYLPITLIYLVNHKKREWLRFKK
jgi:hypothetical protein